MGFPAKNQALYDRTNKRSSDGFTLMEVLIVILILSITAMILLPTINQALERSRLSGAVDEIMIALGFAQMTAMTTGGQTRVTIDAPADTILIEQFKPDGDLQGSETELSEGDVENGSYVTMEYPTNPGTDYYIVFSNEDRFKNVDIESAQFGTQNYVIFNSLGTPSQGGTISITSGAGTVLLTLDGLNGKVTMSE
jgi:prepilin-type N-terminal cleavage/methylation domain-containing protein